MSIKSLNRLCSKCGKLKPIAEFARDPRYAFNHLARCRDCERDYQLKYRSTEKGREARRAAQRRYMERLREGGAANLYNAGSKSDEQA